jgi:hypothetical protein
VNTACLGNVVSCADILAVAARDSIVAVSSVLQFYHMFLLDLTDRNCQLKNIAESTNRNTIRNV